MLCQSPLFPVIEFVDFESNVHATSKITALGVYLPCSDMGMECYSEHFVELENLISKSEHLNWPYSDHWRFQCSP